MTANRKSGDTLGGTTGESKTVAVNANPTVQTATR
jgi:hypothetical protein